MVYTPILNAWDYIHGCIHAYTRRTSLYDTCYSVLCNYSYVAMAPDRYFFFYINWVGKKIFQPNIKKIAVWLCETDS